MYYRWRWIWESSCCLYERM